MLIRSNISYKRKAIIFYAKSTPKFPIHFISVEANPCSQNPCKNGGVCKEMNGVAVCECPQQFEGNMCESK